jgi:hypothetical protein
MLPLLLASPFFIWLAVKYISLDFWYDEAFTLHFFALRPLKETVTNYQLPNNHIFFNLLNNLYFRLTGIVNLGQLLDRPEKLRILMLAYTAVTLFYVYRIGTRFFNAAVACLSLIVLVTTVPFFNFAVQIRGYILSIMLLVMFMYYVWNFEQTRSTGSAVMVAATTMLALYAIPLNLYFLMAATTFYLFSSVFQLWKNESGTLFAGSGSVSLRKELPAAFQDLAVLLYVFLGFSAAVVAYLPVFYLVINNRFVESQGWFHYQTLTKVAPRTLEYFFSQRFAIAAFATLGVVYFVWSLVRRRPLPFTRHTVYCACLLLLPFVFSFVRGDRPYYRVFVNLAPVFALFVSLNLYYGYLMLQRWMKRLHPAWWILLAALYCQVTFAAELQAIGSQVYQDIHLSKRTQNIYYNYYQAHFRPKDLLQQFKTRHFDKNTPVFAGYYFDPATLPIYCQHYQIPFRSIRLYEDELFSNAPQIHVITARPFKCMRKITDRYPAAECTVLNENLSYHNVLQCRKN